MSHAFTSRTVLVVEAEDDVAAALETFFGDAGFETRRATDGGRAIDLIKRTAVPPALVLLDLSVERGWSVLEWLAAQDAPLAQVPVLVLSSMARDEAESFARALGAVGWIDKPVTLAKLLAVWEKLDRVLGWRCADAAESLG